MDLQPSTPTPSHRAPNTHQPPEQPARVLHLGAAEADHPVALLFDDRAVAQGRAVYCWNVDDYEDIDFCRDVGVAWLATHHPGRTKAWLQKGRAGQGSI